MVSLNKIVIFGNVGKDPEIREKTASFSVATTERWKDRGTGEMRERTEWHRVVSFNEHLNKVIAERVTKGTEVYVEGQIHTRKYTDQSGAERQITEVVIQAFKGELKVGRQPGTSSLDQGAKPTSGAAVDTGEIIPF